MEFHFYIIGLLLVLATLFFIKGKTKRAEKYYLVACFIILFFISAFRSSRIGNDTENYIRMFNFYGITSNIFIINTSIEIGYIILNKILYQISSNPLILFIVTSAFIIGVQMKFIYKNSNNAWLSIYLLINLRFFYFALSGIRQSIAMAIIFISYKYLKEKRLVPFIISILIATMFHYSAIVFLIVYPLGNINFSCKIIAIESFLGLVIYFAFYSFMSTIFRIFPMYQHYTTSVYFDGNIRLASVLNFLVILVIFIIAIVTRFNKLELSIVNREKKFNTKIVKCNELHLLLHIMLIGSVISFIAINANMLDRIVNYFFMFSIILVPKIIENLKNKNKKLLLTYLVLVMTLVYNTTILICRPEWQHVYPYEFFWQV